jgi:hypothetical protein
MNAVHLDILSSLIASYLPASALSATSNLTSSLLEVFMAHLPVRSADGLGRKAFRALGRKFQLNEQSRSVIPIRCCAQFHTTVI